MTPIPTKKRRKPSTSPTKRALADLRKLGFTCFVAERWNAFAKVRQDAFGIIDILALREGVGILGIQATSSPNHAARREKALAEPRLRTWLACGGRFEVWSYGLKGAAGTRKLYQLRRQEVTLADLPPVPPEPEVMQSVADLFEGRQS